jgi:hypothetical protein
MLSRRSPGTGWRPLLDADANQHNRCAIRSTWRSNRIRLSLLRTNVATLLVAISTFTDTNDPNADFGVNDAKVVAYGNENSYPDDCTITARLCAGTTGQSGTPFEETRVRKHLHCQ